MTALIPQKLVRYITPDGTLTQEGILLFLSFQQSSGSDAAAIAANASNISSNASNIATNTIGIAANVADIATNTADISTNTAGIAANLALIEEIMAGTEIAQAERVVLSTYGDTVSVEAKAKNLNKFGTNITVGTTYETVARMQGTVANETFVTTNLIDSIVSSNAGDTTQTITIEGQTIDVDGNLTFVVQDAVLNGQTEVTLTTPLARATRMTVKASGTFGTSPAALVGTVYVYDNTDGIVAGVPVTAAATKVLLDIDTTQSNKCATATSSTDYWFITEYECGIGNAAGPANRVTFKLERRDIKNGGAWVPVGREITVAVGNNSGAFLFQPLAIIPPNNDVRVVAKTDSSTCEVFAEVQGYLALIL
jgi:hypothetical protein